MLLMLALITGLPKPETKEPIDGNRYVAVVSVYKGECTYWTGDQGFRAKEFQNDLKRRFDVRRPITIMYESNVPSTCVNRAKKLAKRVGFKDARTELVSKAIMMGPPMPPK